MSTSLYFNNFFSSQEQTLIENLVVESIRQYGHDVYYCPRTVVAKDDIFGEDTVSTYDGSYFVDVYISSYDSYEGDGTFLSKFNLEIRDQIKFVMANRTFDNEIGAETALERPREGDLIYSPMLNRIFVIMYVNNKKTFYQLGALQSYELTCEVWEYSNERLRTNIPEIDNIEDKFSFNLGSFGIITNDNYTIVDDSGFEISQGQFDYDEQHKDVYSDNLEFEEEDEEDEIIDWTNVNPFTESIS